MIVKLMVTFLGLRHLLIQNDNNNGIYLVV